jgi:hypothetical protein
MSALSKPMQELLDEITENGIMYIRYYSQAGRTANALRKRGLIYVKEPDHGTMRMDGYALVRPATTEGDD